MKALTKRKPRRWGEIKSIGISEMEKIEYRQTGMIKVKDTPLSFGELSRLNYEYVDYMTGVRNKHLNLIRLLVWMNCGT